MAAPTLLARATAAAAGSTFVKRASSAVHVAALAVVNEASNTPNHAKRVAWAAVARSDPAGMAQRMVWELLGNWVITDLSDPNGTPGDPNVPTDANIQDAVNGFIDTFTTTAPWGG